MPDKFDPALRMDDQKPGPRPAASYALLYPKLVELVRPLGYALALHGSMNRDFDMVAIPWTNEAVEPEKVAAAICDAIGGSTDWDTEPGKLRPHGRRCWLIWFQGLKWPFGGGACIDLSIMPRTEAAAKAELEVVQAKLSSAVADIANGQRVVAKEAKAEARRETLAELDVHAAEMAEACLHDKDKGGSEMCTYFEQWAKLRLREAATQPQAQPAAKRTHCPCSYPLDSKRHDCPRCGGDLCRTCCALAGQAEPAPAAPELPAVGAPVDVFDRFGRDAETTELRPQPRRSVVEEVYGNGSGIVVDKHVYWRSNENAVKLGGWRRVQPAASTKETP